MASFLVPDQFETLEMEEVNGVIRSLKTKARITGLISLDYTVLLQAYNFVGLPTPGTPLQGPLFAAVDLPNSIYQPLSQLVLSKRRFKVTEDKHTVDVYMDFDHVLDGDNQAITKGFSPNGWFVPAAPVIYGKNRASVQQTKANFYLSQIQAQAFDELGNYPAGSVVDYKGFFWISLVDQSPNILLTTVAPPPGPIGTPLGQLWGILSEQQIIGALLFPPIIPLRGVSVVNPPYRRQLLVGHQFPATDPNVPGQTVFQTGEVTVMQPNDNFKIHGQILMRNPKQIKKDLLGAINPNPWMDGGAWEWMCMEVAWEPMFVEFQWKISMEFQHNEDTWLPTAIFNDARSGRPPAGIIPNFGVRQIHYHKEVDFNSYLSTSFGGAIIIA